MNVSDNGVAFIASFEGFSPVVYDDVAGNATVGYGELLHLGPATPEELARPPITEEQGYAALRRKIQPYAVAVEGMTRPLNQNEFDALVSLCYNIGPGGYLNSSVRTAVNQGGDVCAALNQIIHGTDGVAYPGLIRRRKAECALFYAPITEDAMTDEEKQRFNDLAGAVWNHGLQINEFGRAFFPLAMAYYTTQAVDADQQQRIQKLEAALNDLSAFK